MIPVQSLQRHAIVSNPILSYRTARLRVHVNVCMREKDCGQACVFICACDRRGDLNVHTLESFFFSSLRGTHGHILLASNERGESAHPLIVASVGCACACRCVCRGRIV